MLFADAIVCLRFQITGRSRVWTCSAAKDRSPIRRSEGIFTETPARFSDVQTGVPVVQSCTTHSPGDGKSQKSLAKCGCSLRCHSAGMIRNLSVIWLTF